MDEYVKYSYNTTYILGNDADTCYSYLKERKPFAPTNTLKYIRYDGNVLLGAFEKEGGEAFVLVNFGEPTAQNRKTVSLRFDGDRTVILWQGSRRTENTCEEITVALNPGEGVFIEIA